MAKLSATQVVKIREHATRAGIEELTAVSVAFVLGEWEEFDAPPPGVARWLMAGVWRLITADWLQANGVSAGAIASGGLGQDLIDRLCMGTESDEDTDRVLALADSEGLTHR